MVRFRWTPAQANRTLPLVRPIVRDILAVGKRLRDLAEDRATPERDDSIHDARYELGSLIDELGRIGCSYKDWNFEVGLVDYPGMLEGRRVLFCWRSDEERVTWYHSLEDGFAGRMPIPEELLEGEG